MSEAAGGSGRPAPSGLPRLLPLVPGVPEDLRAHLARYGRLPYRGGPGLLIDGVEQAGLTGRGGAAFPVARKLGIVARARGRKVIVANGAESEPASFKDAVLLRAAPNLVLDGLQLAAEAIGASEAYLYVHAGLSQEIGRALAQRSAAGLDRLPVTVAEAPPRFLAGQESALVNRLSGGPAVPTFVPPRVSERGVGGAPTLVQNVETLAHLALIARYGPRWFRAMGTAEEPGSMLATVHTQDGAQVIEAELGAPLRTLIPARPGGRPGRAHRRLPRHLAAGRRSWTRSRWTTRRWRGTAHRSAPAWSRRCPSGRCGLTEAARVARYLAAESAGQCGPCLNGLPRMAAALAELAGAGHRRQARADLERWTGPMNLVACRGACHHPDGTVRFVRSTLTVFAAEIALHAKGQCSAVTTGRRTARRSCRCPPACRRPKTTGPEE